MKAPATRLHAGHPRSSRQRYRGFVEDYTRGRLDEASDKAAAPAQAPGPAATGRGKRREYLREYLRWLWPYRYAVAIVFFLALLSGRLEMVQPLFMRFIIDKVLLNQTLDTTGRLRSLQLAGAAFLSAIVLSSLVGVLKDYRQRILNVQVMLSLRRSLSDRLLHLPLPKLWDMKTGGAIST